MQIDREKERKVKEKDFYSCQYVTYISSDKYKYLVMLQTMSVQNLTFHRHRRRVKKCSKSNLRFKKRIFKAFRKNSAINQRTNKRVKWEKNFFVSNNSSSQRIKQIKSLSFITFHLSSLIYTCVQYRTRRIYSEWVKKCY